MTEHEIAIGGLIALAFLGCGAALYLWGRRHGEREAEQRADDAFERAWTEKVDGAETSDEETDEDESGAVTLDDLDADELPTAHGGRTRVMLVAPWPRGEDS